MNKQTARRFSKARVTRRPGPSKAHSVVTARHGASELHAAHSALALDKTQDCTIERHHQNMLDGMEVLWRQGALCDVTLVVEDIRMRAHRVVLATCSDYFHGQFITAPDSPGGEQLLETECELILEGLEVTTVESLLECMYTGRITLSEANVRNLLVAAARLRFFAVEHACELFLQERLHRHNCIRMLNLAATYNLITLRDEALKTAAANFSEVSQGYDFLELELEQLGTLISRDDVISDGELEVFRRALSWLEFDKASRMRFVGELLQHVRLPLISPAALVDHVESVDYLTGVPECETLVKEALHYHCLPARQSLLQTSRTNPRAHRRREGILATGGAPRLKNDQVSSDVTFYDPAADQWEVITQLKEPRHHHAVCVLGGFLYVAGGEETNDQRSPLNTALRYDPRNCTWLQIASMRQARESFQLGVLNGRLYAVGGRVDQDISLSEVERYNPAVDRWEGVAPIAAPRRSVALAAHNGRLYAMGGSVGNRLFLVGGATIDGQGNVVCVRKVECYVPTTDTWVVLASMTKPRAEAGCAVQGNYIYVVGGYSWDNNRRLSSVERYDTERDIWSEVKDLGQAYTGVGSCALRIYDLPERTSPLLEEHPPLHHVPSEDPEASVTMETPISSPGLSIADVRAPNQDS